MYRFNELQVDLDQDIAKTGAGSKKDRVQRHITEMDRQLARRDPTEENVFKAVAARCAQEGSLMPLKNLTDMLNTYALFGFRDEGLFQNFAPEVIKNKKKMSDLDFQMTVQNYVKFLRT